MKRSEKDQIINDVATLVGRAKGMFLADFTGITVEQITELRREFRKAKIDYRVVKNTLVKKAFERVTGYDKLYDSLVGPTSIAFSYDDPVAPARIIKRFTDKNQKLIVKVCVLDTQVFEGKDLKVLAALPSRAEILGGIIGCIQSPIQGVVGAIAAVMRDLVSVVDEIAKKKAA